MDRCSSSIRQCADVVFSVQQRQAPAPGTKSIYICPSAHKPYTPDPGHVYYNYAISTCLHTSGLTKIGFRRDRMQAPSTTIIFCEEPESDPTFGVTNGKYIAEDPPNTTYNESTARHSVV